VRLLESLETVLKLSTEVFSKRLVDGLSGPGFAVFPDLLRSELTNEIRVEIGELEAEGRFRPAAIGKGTGSQRDPEIRGDGTHWFEPDRLTSVQARLAELFSEAKRALNRELYLGLWDWEGHYAVYPPGTFYRTHLDRFQNDSKRTVSMVFFFNLDWGSNDGGKLRLESGGDSIEITPESGTAVFFLSDRIPHEVLETNRKRMSFAGWFRTRS
jgi:SM-20-related protein